MRCVLLMVFHTALWSIFMVLWAGNFSSPHQQLALFVFIIACAAMVRNMMEWTWSWGDVDGGILRTNRSSAICDSLKQKKKKTLNHSLFVQFFPCFSTEFLPLTHKTIYSNANNSVFVFALNFIRFSFSRTSNINQSWIISQLLRARTPHSSSSTATTITECMRIAYDANDRAAVNVFGGA